jgi:hypothetical protein
LVVEAHEPLVVDTERSENPEFDATFVDARERFIRFEGKLAFRKIRFEGQASLRKSHIRFACGVVVGAAIAYKYRSFSVGACGSYDRGFVGTVRNRVAKMQHPPLGARIHLVRDDRKIVECEFVQSIADDRCDARAHDLQRHVAVAARACEDRERGVDAYLPPQERGHVAKLPAHEHITKGARPLIETALRFFPCLFTGEEFDEDVERVTIGDRAVEVDEDRPVCD